MKSKLTYYLVLGGGFLGSLLIGFLVYKLLFKPPSKEEAETPVIPKIAKNTSEASEKNEDSPAKEEKEETKEEVKTEEPPKEDSHKEDAPKKEEPQSESKEKPAEVPAQGDGKSEMSTQTSHATIAEGQKEEFDNTAPLLKQKESPRLSLIVTGLGLDNTITNMAITELPPEIGLSFSPYSKMINRWISPAKERQHLIFIELPTEEDVNMQGVLLYFDGVLFTHGKDPLKDPKKIEELLRQFTDKKKIIVDQRLLPENLLAIESKKQEFKTFYFVDYNIIPENVIMDGQDPFQKDGIVTISAELVPYLIKQFKKSSPKIPLKPVYEDKDASKRKA